MWPPQKNWRQIHHSDKIDMNKIFKGTNFYRHTDTPFSVIYMYHSFECNTLTDRSMNTGVYVGYAMPWMNDRQRTVTGNKKNYTIGARSFPTICLEFDLNFFFVCVFVCSLLFLCAKIIYRWNEKFNVLVISICLGTTICTCTL